MVSPIYIIYAYHIKVQRIYYACILSYTYTYHITYRLSLVSMDQDSSTTDDLKEMIREELKECINKQDILEKQINLLLLPRDPNDHRNVMLEVRAGKIH